MKLSYPRWYIVVWRILYIPMLVAILGFTLAQNSHWWQEVLLWLPMMLVLYAMLRMDVSTWTVSPDGLHVVGMFRETEVPAAKVESVEYFKTNDSVKVYGPAPLRWEMPFTGSRIMLEKRRDLHRARVAEIEQILTERSESLAAEDATAQIAYRWVRPRARDLAWMVVVSLPAALAIFT